MRKQSFGSHLRYSAPVGHPQPARRPRLSTRLPFIELALILLLGCSGPNVVDVVNELDEDLTLSISDAAVGTTIPASSDHTRLALDEGCDALLLVAVDRAGEEVARQESVPCGVDLRWVINSRDGSYLETRVDDE